MVTISDKAKSLAALCEAKEELAREATKCNAHSQHLVAEFHKAMQETSDRQKDILEKMAAVDESIKKIAQTC